ncbi:hypothetical protein ACIBCT_18710 [Streptosporangium sp. NPDC050855]|uniref:hypothetical protein n=1 Tax=Streptosporangium sp. NPDC050855 TaxID=3366194 RepID=UPI0037B80FE9
MADQPHPAKHTQQCSTCQADPGPDNSLMLIGAPRTITQIWHAPDCAEHLQWQRQIEASAKQVRREDQWAVAAFPAGYTRLQEAVRALPAEQRESPFVAALAELVGLQAIRQASGGGFVILPEWAKILDRHFPPERP